MLSAEKKKWLECISWKNHFKVPTLCFFKESSGVLEIQIFYQSFYYVYHRFNIFHHCKCSICQTPLYFLFQKLCFLYIFLYMYSLYAALNSFFFSLIFFISLKKVQILYPYTFFFFAIILLLNLIAFHQSGA